MRLPRHEKTGTLISVTKEPGERVITGDLIARVRTERASVNLSDTRLKAPFDGLVSEKLVDAGSFVGPGQPLLILEERQTMRVDVPVSSNQAAAMSPRQSLSVVVPVTVAERPDPR